ncbi:LAGLIDADG family DNA endonuclease [Anoxybacillus flavithermus]|uniref:LAGLIDADG family DNA endonuclease n=1 Tax=Anoxybacillus flavithermus (strain DSM 21510 / WK1) TaxID=491915 RepID=B7GKZ4_ANOFW|nr:LAGLIDADG family DNA endonuclease [Anoxybacillus flavithermus]ACJ34931.1 LAGLIDADG family DNA endonuclease [Anoxybacillus flavithermus WK1]
MEILQQLSIEALSMINGKLLGDANISVEKNRFPRFRFAHSASDKAWCVYCYEQLNKHLPLSKPRYRKILDSRIKNGFTEQYYTQSLKSKVILQLKDLWYPDNHKTIPFEFLAHSFTPICLAWWYQDDGHLKIESNQVKKIILSTDGFKKTENEALIQLIRKQYGLNFSLDKQNRLILYDKPQIFYFIRLVKPYVHESMKRKVAIPPNSKEATKKRTTIYLPNVLHITRPTRDIHAILEELPYLYSKLLDEHTYKKIFTDKFPILKINKTIARPYQIELTQKHIELINVCRQITGLTVSQVVHLCAIYNV